MRSKVKRVVLCLLILFLIVSAASGEEGANSLTADGAFFFPSLETAYALPGENAFGQVLSLIHISVHLFSNTPKSFVPDLFRLLRPNPLKRAYNRGRFLPLRKREQ